ncbi:MAG: DUF1320 family protein [Prevotella sp.]|nr:DUF1320 family protein [Prevotella sp.]
MFLTEDDYKSVCDTYEFETLQADTAVRLTAERAAIEQVKGYTRHRYDMEKAFSAEGCDRNPMLVQVTVNIALWLMIHRLPQQMGHERRECLYKESIQWLKDVQASKASPDLPTYVSEDGDTDAANPVKWGSEKPSRCSW